jgi:uncharacterized DUF497 family protein
MRFEWDERKRLSNLLKHGLDFRRVDKKIGCDPGDLDEEGEA